MKKYKVKFYEDGKVREKEVEADGFHFRSGTNSVTFYASVDGAKEELHAFGEIACIEKI